MQVDSENSKSIALNGATKQKILWGILLWENASKLENSIEETYLR